MHTYHDDATGITIHHNGDYSGEAIVTVAVDQVLTPEQLAIFPLPLKVDFGGPLPLGEYPLECELNYDTVEDDERVRLLLKLPARVLVEFAAGAIGGAYISMLEQFDPIDHL